MRDRFDIDQVIKITGLGIHAEQAYGGADFDVACQIVVKKLWKIKEYESLEKQGKLLKLPCAVGDTVFEIYKGEIIERIVRGILFRGGELWGQDGNGSNFGIFGKTVFLTREEAEAALKEIREG